MGQWVERCNGAWYTLTAEDRDLDALAAGLLEALRLRVPGLTRDVSLGRDSARGPEAERDGAVRAPAFAALLCGALQEHLRSDLTLILDDVHEVRADDPSMALIEGLCRQAPPRLHIVLSSRENPPFSVERMRGRGDVSEITGAALAFDDHETSEVLRRLLGEGSLDLVVPMRKVTEGWPVAVRLAAEALRTVPAKERPRELERVGRPGGPVFSYLAEEVFAREAPEVTALVRTVAPLERFTDGLAQALGIDGARELLIGLDRRGLFVEPRGEEGWYQLSPLVREFVLERLPLEPQARAGLFETAALWFEANGRAAEALSCLCEIDDLSGASRVLAEHGSALLASGAAGAVVAAAARLPEAMRSAAVEQVVGEAHQIRGNWDGALECYRRIAGEGPLDPAVAWRMGLIHHLRGDLDEALAAYTRGLPVGEDSADRATLLAWTASVRWLRGEMDQCRALAQRAFDIARGLHDDRALAIAHTVLAMVAAVDSDRRANDAHYLRALDHAERAGDALQIIRIRGNRGSRLIEESYFEQALDELGVAIELAELAGYAWFQALSLTNRGDALFRMGRMDEAVADLEAAKAIYQRLGSRMIGYPLGLLGDVFRERGDLALARAAYEETLTVSEGSGDVQGLVPALSGLARILAEEEPEEAARLAERAVGYGAVLSQQGALLAAGWGALARNDRAEAASRADEAATVARSRRDRAAVAESLELQALSSLHPEQERHRLEEARAIWRELGGPIGEARVDLALARLTTGEGSLALAERAERRFQELGLRRYAAAAGDLRAAVAAREVPPVAIHSLGGFRVLRSGAPVPLTDWQSRKARSLLKFLVARRGQPVHREELIEAMWPDEDPTKTSSRLSVALSTLRSVLDPDKLFDAERFVTADRDTVRLNLANVWVDVESFLPDATAGLRSGRDRAPDAAARLVAAEAAYAGDFLPEDPYEEWTIALREEARNAYVGVARTLARDSIARGDHDAASRYLLRILERDTFDERAHLALIDSLTAAGRHGEARRAYRAYTAKMTELGIEALAFPVPTR